MLRGPDHIAMRTGVCEVCIRDQLSQHIGAHPQGNQMNTPSRFVNEETSSGNPVPRGETLENEIVDPRFCDCVVFGAWRHCRRGIDAGARPVTGGAKSRDNAPRGMEPASAPEIVLSIREKLLTAAR